MKVLKKIVTACIVLVIFYYLLTSLIENWQKIPFHSLHFNVIYLITSFVFLSITFIIFVEAWRTIIHELGHTISFKKAFWIMSSSQIAKYVPGGIWFALGRVYLSKGEKLQEEKVALSVVVETVLTFLTGILIFIISISLAEKKIFSKFVFVIPLFFLFLTALYPPLLNRIMNFVLKVAKKPTMHLDVSYSQILQISTYFFGLWSAQIVGFYFLVNAIYPLVVSKILPLAAAYTISWMTGFVVIFAPGGLGVREGMMTLLLSSLVPTPLAIAVSFIARVWITIFEILVFFVGLLLKKAGNKSTGGS